MPPYKQCLNCGTDLQGVYCHKCGQQASNPTPKVWEFIQEYMSNAFIWDTKCLVTIWQLIRRPGYLTNVFNAGRFVTYENPFKLNMFFLFVFVTLFLLFSDMQKANDLTRNEFVRPYLSLKALNENVDYKAKMEASERDTIQLALPLPYAKEFPEIVTTIRAVTDYDGEKLDTLVVSIPKVLIQDGIILYNGSAVYNFADKNDIIEGVDFEKQIKENVKSTLKALNQKESFKINYGMNYFPEKIYKGVKYEEGEYESLVIELGDGLGDNFWCVLFPPLCLLEGEEQTKTDVEYTSFIKEIINKYF